MNLNQHSNVNIPSTLVKTDIIGEIRMEGWLRKKGQHVHLWRERYFMIRATSSTGPYVLCYYRKKGDKEPRGIYILGPGCTVDEVRESPSKIETKRLFTFRISNYSMDGTSHNEEDYNNHLNTTPSRVSTINRSGKFNINSPSPRENVNSNSHSANAFFQQNNNELNEEISEAKLSFKKRKARIRRKKAAAAAAAATAVVLTGGLAGVGMGAAAATAAASAGVGALFAQAKRKQVPLALAAESIEIAEWWRNGIMDSIKQAIDRYNIFLESLSSYNILDTNIHDSDIENQEIISESPRNINPITDSVGQTDDLFSNHNPNKITHTNSRNIIQSNKLETVPRMQLKNLRSNDGWSSEKDWAFYDLHDSLIIYNEVSHNKHLSKYSGGLFSFDFIPTLKTSLKIKDDPSKVFNYIMDIHSMYYEENKFIKNIKIIKKIDQHSDIIYFQLVNIHYFQKRDFYVLRYWRQEENGVYVICYQSYDDHEFNNKDSTCIRGNMLGGGYIISPRVQSIVGGLHNHSNYNNNESYITLTCQLDPCGWLHHWTSYLFHYKFMYQIIYLEQILYLKVVVERQKYVKYDLENNRFPKIY